jgi:CRP-like cAMP-binding protein
MPYPLTNILVDALSDSSRRNLSPHLAQVSMPLHTPLYELNEVPRYAHFLTSGVASLVVTANDGSTTEVGTIGREGVPQAGHLMGPLPVPTRCFMQIAGTALRIELSVFQRLFEEDHDLRQIILAYLQYQAYMLGQVAGCNRLHGAEARLSRWLLMIQDRTCNSLLKLTQEFVGELIGSQRTTVSEVAGALQERGLITYSRGTIRIIDRAGLKKTSCECFHVTRRLLAGVYRLADQPLYQG